MAQPYGELATPAAHTMGPHVDSLARLVAGEADGRRDRATKSRLRLARVPLINTLEQFRWDWPTRINRLQMPHQFHLQCIQDTAHRIFLGGGGLGQTHWATARGSAACLQGSAGLFASAMEVINTLAAAQ
jgi:DNA replication protein DnaC